MFSKFVLFKALEFVVQLIPMAILWTTLVCLFGVLYAGLEFLSRRGVSREDTPQYRPGVLAVLLTLIGTAAMLVCGMIWLRSLNAPVPAFELVGTQFTVGGLYFMASAIVFDIGAVLLLCSQTRRESEPQTVI